MTPSAPWSRRLPPTWRVLPLATCCTEVEEPNLTSDAPVLSLSYGAIVRRDVDSNFGLLPESFDSYNRVRSGDVVLRLTDLQNDRTSLRVGRVLENGIITSAYVTVRTRTPALLPQWLYYVLHSYDVQKSFYALGGGVRQAAHYESVRRLPLILPPVRDQARMSERLDRLTSAIDDLVGHKRRLLELLAEERRSIVAHTVTPGVSYSTRHTGTLRLDGVPSSWTVVRLKFHMALVTSGSRGWSEHISDTGALFLQSGALGNNLALDVDNAQRVQLPPRAEGVRTRVALGDVLVCITGGRTGNVAVVQYDIEEAYVNQHVALVRVNAASVDPMYLGHYLASPLGRSQFARAQYGGTKQGLGLDDIKNIIIGLPPLTEQKSIVARVTRATRSIDRAIASTQESIQRMREYRDALVVGTVTPQAFEEAA